MKRLTHLAGIPVRAHPRLKTGSKSLDTLLGGGVERGVVTEFFGEPSCGKTQIMTRLCVSAVGLGARALVVDSEGTFSPLRLRAMAGGVLEEEAMGNVLYLNPSPIQASPMLLKSSVEEFSKLGSGGLVAVDTLGGLASAAVGRKGRAWSAYVHEVLRLLVWAAVACGLYVCVFSGVRWRRWFVESECYPVDAYAAHTRVMLSTLESNLRVAKLVKARDSPGGEAAFLIGETGPRDEEGA
ncbi:MAG: hypothetical protein M1357_02300 [Candidatus Marsarchaeota archaeon]|nr:hypothetical protein [Candidatus Marsarchaeota archaeon]